MRLHARRHNGMAIDFEPRALLIRSERFDQLFHNPLANFLFLKLDNKGGSNSSVVEQFHNVLRMARSPCRSYRESSDVAEPRNTTDREYYNESRTHLSVSKDAPVPRAIQAHGRTYAIPLLGGLHHQYVRI
jgi:hypothetical protein